jgi:hypothetical protein
MLSPLRFPQTRARWADVSGWPRLDYFRRRTLFHGLCRWPRLICLALTATAAGAVWAGWRTAHQAGGR